MVTPASFRRGFRSAGEEALKRALSTLLHGIGRHAARVDVNGARAFDTSVKMLRDEIETTKDPDVALVIADLAVQALGEHCDAGARRIEETQRAWRDLVRKLLGILDRITPPAGGTPGVLRLLERDLDSAVRAEDIHTLQARAESYLARAGKSAATKPAATSAAGVMPPESRIYAESAPGETDEVTGLPDSRVAAHAISAAWENRKNRYIVAFVLERMEAINARFGSGAGDQIIQAYSQSLAQSLNDSDQLFRWSEPCLMALIARETPEGPVAAEMARVASSRREQMIVVRGRKVTVPVSPTWGIFALEEHNGADDACRRVDEFVQERLLAGSGTPSGHR